MTLGENIIATCNAARCALLAAYRSMPYSDYILTDHWLSVRKAALYRAGGRCQLCGRQERLQVHHNSYENLGHELPEDLIVLCQSCHEKFHKKGPNGNGTQRVPDAPNGGGTSSIAETNETYSTKISAPAGANIDETGTETSGNGTAMLALERSIEYRPRRHP